MGSLVSCDFVVERGMSFHCGELPGVSWACVVGEASDETLEAFVAQLERVGRRSLPGHVVLDLMHDVPLPNPLQRQRLTEAVQKVTARGGVGGHALVTNSTIARGVLSAINWFVRPAFPERTFREPKAAVAWLCSLNPKLDGDALLADIERHAPPFRALRW